MELREAVEIPTVEEVPKSPPEAIRGRVQGLVFKPQKTGFKNLVQNLGRFFSKTTQVFSKFRFLKPVLWVFSKTTTGYLTTMPRQNRFLAPEFQKKLVQNLFLAPGF